LICRIISNVGIEVEIVFVADRIVLEEPAEGGGVVSGAVAILESIRHKMSGQALRRAMTCVENLGAGSRTKYYFFSSVRKTPSIKTANITKKILDVQSNARDSLAVI